MSWSYLLTGLALVLVIEGLMPFANPGGFRRYLLTLAQQPDGSLRTAGLISMLIGVGLLYLVN